MSFTHIQGAAISGSGGFSGITLFNTALTPGNLACIVFSGDGDFGSASVADTNGNVYTVSPNSPSTIAGAQVWVFYLLKLSANAAQTFNCSFTNVVNWDIATDEFSVGGTAVFDTDIRATGTGTSVNAPTITPSKSGELLYAGAASFRNFSNTNPSPWFYGGGTVNPSLIASPAEYILSGSSPTPVKWTQSSGNWAAVAMAFNTVAPMNTEVGGVDNSGDYWLGGDWR